MKFSAKPEGGRSERLQGPETEARGGPGIQGPGTGWPGAIGGKTHSPSGEPSVYQLSVRVTAEERELWVTAAGEDSLANWMRTTLTAAALDKDKDRPTPLRSTRVPP